MFHFLLHHFFVLQMDILSKRTEYVGKRLVALPDVENDSKNKKTNIRCQKWLRKVFQCAIIRETVELDKMETEFVVSS